MNAAAFVRPLAMSLSVFLFAGCAADSDLSEDELASQDDELSTYEVSQAGTKLKVTASALNMRSGGGTGHGVVEVLKSGAIVTVRTTSGSNGWTNVTAASGRSGWVLNKYVTAVSGSSANPSTDGGSSSSNSTSSGATCAASRATGVTARYAKALHDSIAFAEGTRGYSKDGYNVLFGFSTISSCSNHPNVCTKYGRTCSTAAGRYQFLTKTWNSAKSARGLSSFEPENQERAASYLVTNVRRVTVPSGRAMTSAEFTNAMNKLSYEWASLPPGRYGQPNKTMSQMRTTYCSAAGGC